MPSSKKDDQKRSPGVKRGVKGLALVGVLGWISAALLFADRIEAQDMTGSLHNALVRSQTERHELSKQLKSMSDELEVLEKRLSRYQNQETRAAVNP
jgi:septal ring factor EnvC (AmiA/AmiB activator)